MNSGAGWAFIEDVGVYEVAERSDVRRCGVLFRTFLLRTCDLREGDPFELEWIELSNLGIIKLGPVCSECVKGWVDLECRGVRSISDDRRLLIVTFSGTASGDRLFPRADDMLALPGSGGSNNVLTPSPVVTSLSEGSSSISLWFSPAVETSPSVE